MVDPERAGRSFLKRFDEELFIPRNVYGELNDDVLSFSDDIVHRFSKHKFFVGVTLRGSQIRGYSLPDSDADIRILYDSSDPSYSVEKLDSIFDEIQTKPKKVSVKLFWCDMGGPDAGLSGEHLGYNALCELSFGSRVEEYRKRFSESLKALSKEKRTQVLQEILLDLLYYETSRIPVLKERIPEFAALSQMQVSAIMQKRKTMWEERIREVFELHKS